MELIARSQLHKRTQRGLPMRSLVAESCSFTDSSLAAQGYTGVVAIHRTWLGPQPATTAKALDAVSNPTERRNTPGGDGPRRGSNPLPATEQPSASEAAPTLYNDRVVLRDAESGGASHRARHSISRAQHGSGGRWPCRSVVGQGGTAP